MIRNIRLQVIVAVAGLVLIGALLLWQLPNRLFTIQVPAQGGTYVEGIAGTPQFINPLLSQYNQVDRDLAALLFDGMTRLDERGMPEPRLATDWQISDDGLVYTFHLRPNVQWADGQAFNADDVVFTIGLLQDPGYSGPADVAALWRTVTITRVNELEVQFALPEPYAPFLDYTTIGVLPEHLLRGVTAAGLLSHPFNTYPVGTGPLMLDEGGLTLVNGRIEGVRLKNNPYYWDRARRAAHLSKVEFRFFPDDAAVLAAYEAGEVQGVARVRPVDLPRAQADVDLSLYTARLPGYTMVLFNTANIETPYLGEAPVRQALLLALNRQYLIDKVIGGQGIVADSPILPGTWAYDPGVQRYEGNLSQARAILDSAGWTLGGVGQGEPGGGDPTDPGGTPPDLRAHEGVVMAFTLLVSADPQRVALGEALAEQWQQLGVKVTVKPVVGSLARDYLAPHQFEAALVDVVLPGDPDLYAFWHETQVDNGQNYAGYRDRDMSEVLEKARMTTDVNERIALYARFQQMFTRDLPALLLYYPTYTYGVDQKVGGVQILSALADPSDRFRNMADWYVVRRRVVTSRDQ